MGGLIPCTVQYKLGGRAVIGAHLHSCSTLTEFDLRWRKVFAPKSPQLTADETVTSFALPFTLGRAAAFSLIREALGLDPSAQACGCHNFKRKINA